MVKVEYGTMIIARDNQVVSNCVTRVMNLELKKKKKWIEATK